MQISQVGINLIKSFEGCQLTAYRDPVGVLTIGYGHTSGVRDGEVITQQQAEDLLRQDLDVYENGINSGVKVPLNQYQFDALVSFSYNVGVSAFLQSTLLELLNKGDYVDASNEFDKWVHAGGKVLQGLVTRRNAEKALFLKQIEVPAKPQFQTYTVRSGENLTVIAKRFNTTVDNLMHLNPWIKNRNLIQIGWKITVPAK